MAEQLSTEHLLIFLSRAGCYEVVEAELKGLYGLDPSKSLAAEKAPWSLNETEIVTQSWRAYTEDSREGWLPGSFNLNPFGDNFRDHSPILPTCYSDYQDVSKHDWKNNMPCTCGNKYGNESERFWQAATWATDRADYEELMLASCFLEHSMKSMALHNPAAYLVNMCQVLYYAIAPSGSSMSKTNQGHYRKNKSMCSRVLYFYEDNKDRDDAFLDENICKIWVGNMEDKHRNLLHYDWSHVNSQLRKGGCRPYKKWWSHECKKGKNIHRCGYPEGY